jgi:hypothetical protein
MTKNVEVRAGRLNPAHRLAAEERERERRYEDGLQLHKSAGFIKDHYAGVAAGVLIDKTFSTSPESMEAK